MSELLVFGDISLLRSLAAFCKLSGAICADCEEAEGGRLFSGAGVALLRTGVVFGGIAEADARVTLAGRLGAEAATAEDDTDFWAKAGAFKVASSDRLQAIKAGYLAFQSGKTFMRLFISRSSIPSYSSTASSSTASSRAASSYNLLTL